MVVPISPSTSLDTASIENSWFSNTIFVLQMDGQGLPSPNIYECVDLLRISGFPPSLTNAFLPIQDCCAPVSIMHFETLGLLVWYKPWNKIFDKKNILTNFWCLRKVLSPTLYHPVKNVRPTSICLGRLWLLKFPPVVHVLVQWARNRRVNRSFHSKTVMPNVSILFSKVNIVGGGVNPLSATKIVLFLWTKRCRMFWNVKICVFGMI